MRGRRVTSRVCLSLEVADLIYRQTGFKRCCKQNEKRDSGGALGFESKGRGKKKMQRLEGKKQNPITSRRCVATHAPSTHEPAANTHWKLFTGFIYDCGVLHQRSIPLPFFMRWPSRSRGRDAES